MTLLDRPVAGVGAVRHAVRRQVALRSGRPAPDRPAPGHPAPAHPGQAHGHAGAGSAGAGSAGAGSAEPGYAGPWHPVPGYAGRGLADTDPSVAPPSTQADTAVARAAVAAARDRARDHLLSLQDSAGWWKGELETNVTIEAEDLLLRQFLGILTDTDSVQTARWIRSRQRSDGSWANFADGPADVSTTVEAWVALRLAGDRPDAAHMVRARDSVLVAGGVEATRVFTRVWLALFGLQQWDTLPVMPPELILLPTWAPLNIYDWGCWARQTIVPLTIVGALRPVRPLGFDVAELCTGVPAPRSRGRSLVGGAFLGLDRVLHRYERRPLRGLRRESLARAAEWVIARQEADGSWGGIQPPWVYSLIALSALGYPLDHPVMRAGVSGLDRFTVREPGPQGTVRRLEACQSPVWDTVLAMVALRDAGLAPGDPALTRARDWVVGEEVDRRGDWAIRRPDLAPGGWSFEFDNDGYPDVDDTAEALIALLAVAPDSAGQSARRRGLRWLLGMQSRNGGWGAFDADNVRGLSRALPFSDFGAVTDPPSADVTAHAVEALAAEGLSDHPATRRGVAWLLAHQEADGSWFGRWGANHVYGTGAVVPALVAAGIRPSHPAIQRAVAWLDRYQNTDGGWGEDLRSYRDRSWVGRGPSTPSQTGWALLALLAANSGPHPGGPGSASCDRGIAYLVREQRADGTWDEPLFTGTGFPGDFYINYHLYRLLFPLTALGRYLRDAR